MAEIDAALGEWLIPKAKHNATLGELDRKQRVLVLYSDEGKGSASNYVSKHNSIADSRALTHNPWANVPTTAELKVKLDRFLAAETDNRRKRRRQQQQQQQQQDRLFVLQLVLTVGVKEIVAGVCGVLSCCLPPYPPASIHDLVWPGTRSPWWEWCNRRAGNGVGGVAAEWLEEWVAAKWRDEAAAAGVGCAGSGAGGGGGSGGGGSGGGGGNALNVVLCDWVDASAPSIALLQQIIAANDPPPQPPH